MKTKGKVGSSRLSVPENDATDAKWLDDLLKMSEEAQKAIDYAAAHPPCLSVPDVGTEKEFVKKAKQVYREAHIPVLKRGPRPKESFAINLLAHLSRNRLRNRGQQLTKKDMAKLLMNRNLLKADRLSQNTADKYVRLFCLASQDVASFSQKDQQWLSREFGSESLSAEWWRNRMLGPWLNTGVGRSGFGEEILKIFEEYTPTELQQQRDKLDAARDQLHEQYAKEREQRRSTNAQDGLAETTEFDKKFIEHFLNGSP